uniref:Endodeoxyribonuclease n=1 Tax=Dulem virus 31 TaxID=3145749 RepID=A0AAU8AW36_9VIRU
MIEFTIPIQPVTKKNSMNVVPITTKTGKTRYIPLPSKQFKEFEKACKPYLSHVKEVTGIIDYPVNIKCVFFVGKRFRYDLTNLLEAIDDSMVTSGLLADDNRDIIAAHDGSRVHHDKFTPRIEITITKMENYTTWTDNSVQQKLI